jgi:hypothetical protein
LCYGKSWNHMVVGQETQSFSRIGIDKMNQVWATIERGSKVTRMVPDKMM